jgi:glucose-1-phosphate thymidylyltransferase
MANAVSTVKFAIVDATAGAAAHPAGTSSSSRYLTQIANAPLIGHVVAELGESGIEQARIIAAPEVRRDLGRILGGGGTWGVEVLYLDAPPPEEHETVLSQIEQALSTGPVLLHPGDCLYGRQLSAMRDRFSAGDVDSVLPAQASVEPLRQDDDQRVSDTALLLGPGTRPLLRDLLTPAREGDDLVATLLHSGCRLAVCEQSEHWRYSESTEALLVANRMMLDTLAATAESDEFGTNNRLYGRIAISTSAQLSNCSIYGPVSIDDRAVLEDCFIGPYTAIGPDVVLSGAEVDNSMILTGAQVRHPGFRIEGSIIGERARIERSFELPKGLHLRLGPDSRVTLS